MRLPRPLLALAGAAVLLAVPAVASAVGTDREDAIPASVGPANVRGFYINQSTPPGIDPTRWVALTQRVLRRWGDTFLGFTASSPTAHTDRQNVIGFSTLGPGGLGRTNSNDAGATLVIDRTDQCTTVDVPGTNDTITANVRRAKFRLRRDLIRKGRVKRRTITRSAERRSESVERVPLTGTQCLTGPDVETSRLSNRDVDIEIGSNPSPYFWDLGPAYPTNSQLDLEETLLHEVGHAHGLAHQLVDCDVTTPMRAQLPPASWWRGQDEAAWSDCGTTSMSPGDVPPDPGALAGAPLAGITVFANPALAGGLDPARFALVVQAVVTRLGGTYGGTTTKAPEDPDGTSVVGVGPVFGLALLETVRLPLETALTVPAHGECTAARRTFTIHVLKRASIKRRVGKRLVKLRRDHFVNHRQTRSSFLCEAKAAATSTVGTGTEVDVLINDRYAYELGPSHPVLGTRYDMETAVLEGLLDATGSPRSTDPCITTTPVAPLMPGDWWRGPSDVSRAQCDRSDDAIPAQAMKAGPPRVRRLLTVIR